VIILRIFLGLFLVALSVYTAIVISSYGINLFPYFFGDMLALTWAGQFNFDFMGFLFLSAFWVMWRNQFTLKGIAWGIAAFFGGMAFLTIYLLYLSFSVDGDIRKMLVADDNLNPDA
jgi:hypothetical protein